MLRISNAAGAEKTPWPQRTAAHNGRLNRVNAGGKCRAGANHADESPETFQMETPHTPGSLASVIIVLIETSLILKYLSVVRSDQNRTLWEFTVEIDESAQADLFGRLNAIPSARFVRRS